MKGEEAKGGNMGESVVWSVNPSFPPLEAYLLREASPGLPLCHNGDTIWEEKLSKLPSIFVL